MHIIISDDRLIFMTEVPIPGRKEGLNDKTDSWSCSNDIHRIDKIQQRAVLTRSNIVRCFKNNCQDWGRISIRCWIHKKHLIPGPNERTNIFEKFNRVYTCLMERNYFHAKLSPSGHSGQNIPIPYPCLIASQHTCAKQIALGLWSNEAGV